MPQRNKGSVQFGKTPEQMRAEQAAHRQKMDEVKSRGLPVGGVPPVHIPNLAAKHVEGGGTMQQQAEIVNDSASPLSPNYDPKLREGKAQVPGGPFQPLPPEADNDPRTVPGVGSNLAANQPHMTDSSGAYKPPIGEKSMEALKDLEQKATEVQQREAQKAQEAVVADVEKQVEEGGVQAEKELRSLLGDTMTDVLNNEERKREIESRLEPLDLIEYITSGELTQEVVIVPDKLSVTLRTPSIDEDLSVKRLMYEERGGDRYVMDKYTLMNLTLGIVAINGQEIPSHLDKQGQFDENLFLRKYGIVRKMPMQLVGDFGVQFMWFDHRVRRLLAGQTDAIKNT